MALFNMNSGFFKFVSRFLDVLYLNLLWIIFSLPIITIGASTTAVYYVTQKMVDDEEGYVGKMFVKAFKENFKKGTFFWIITAAATYALYIIWQVVTKSEEIFFLWILLAILATAFVIMVLLYTMPLTARYENTISNTMKNSFLISVQHFGRTIFIVVLVLLELAIIFWNRWTFFIGILIGPVIIIYTVSGISKRIFQKIEKDGVAANGVNVEHEQKLLEEEAERQKKLQNQSEE